MAFRAVVITVSDRGSRGERVDGSGPAVEALLVGMDMEIVGRRIIPDEYMGDVIGDLNSRRGKVLGMDSIGHHQIIKGQVPLAEVLKYAPDLRSLTSGRGTFTYEHSHYEEVPAFIAEKIIAESKKAKAEE